MGRVIAAILVIASGICLYFALTQPVVVSRLADLKTIIRVVYPETAFNASQQGKPATPASGAAAPATPAPATPASPPTAPASATPMPAPAPGQAAAPTPYEARVAQYEKLFTAMVLNNDEAKQNFAELTKPKGYTAWQSARVLYDAGDVVSGTLIIAFSVVYPVAKTLALLVLILANANQKRALRLAELTHKYTMLDVFVAAVTVVSVSTQKLLEIDTGPAILWYIGYLAIGFASVLVLIRARRTPATVTV